MAPTVQPRERRGWVRDFIAFVSLKPYGDTLCAPAARLWIFVIRIAVAIMAASEALAWSYVSWWLTDGPARYGVVAFVFSAVFLLIAGIDSQFLTFDMHARRYELVERERASTAVPRGRVGRTFAALGRGLSATWKSPLPGFLVRVAIVLGSLAISKDYLTQAVLRKDISAQLEQKRTDRVGAGVRTIEQRFDVRIGEIDEQRAQLRADSVREAAGTGASRRAGRGPAVVTVEARLRELQAERDAIERQKQQQIARFTAATDAQRAREFGLRTANEGGLQERSAALAQLKQSPGFADAQRPINAYLIGVFLTIFVLKAFQRRSVTIYLSERLQATYTDYLAGAFDEWVPVGVRSRDARKMGPFEFEDWYFASHANRMKKREIDAQLGDLRDQYGAYAEILDERAKSAGTELSPLEEQLRQLDEKILDVLDSISDVESQKASLDAAVAAQQVAIDAMNRELLEMNDEESIAVGAESSKVYVDALRRRSRHVESIGKARREAAELEVKRKILDRDLAEYRRKQNEKQAQLQLKQRYRDASEAERDEARLDELRQLQRVRKQYSGEH